MTCLGLLSLEATEARLVFMGFLPEDVLCPTQVLRCPCQAAGGQWMLDKDPNLSQDQKVLAQDGLSSSRRTKVHLQLLPGRGHAPQQTVPKKRGSPCSP